jgi:hypothetical protein
LTHRCRDCGLDFYVKESTEGVFDEVMADDQVIDDEEALHEAEEGIEKKLKEDDDQRYR